jgi:hypothetical protein
MTFFELVQLAENIVSLELASTHVLNMDVFDAKHLHKLRNLYISSVKISDTTLLSIINQSHETMYSIWVQRVQLKSGT